MTDPGPLPPITAYTDAFSFAPGDTLPVRVSSEAGAYQADLVRLVSTETERDGTGFLEEVVAEVPASVHAGRVQGFRLGSYASVPDHPALHPSGAFTIAAWIQPTTPGRGRQAILAHVDGEGRGYALELTDEGALELSISGASGAAAARTSAPLQASRWYFVAASVDPDRGEIRLTQQPEPTWPVEPTAASVTAPLPAGFRPAPAEGQPLTMASRGGSGSFFNGRIDRPRIFAAALDDARLGALRAGADAASIGPVIAAWDFSVDIPTERIHDSGPSSLHGRTHHLPARAMPDHTWHGQVLDWTRDPSCYGAIHFHDDDLADAGWAADFTVTLPVTLPSGMYAVRLTAGDGSYVDRLPLVVRAPSGRATNRLLYLQSTNTHLAYANAHARANEEDAHKWSYAWPYELTPEKAYGERTGLLSMYDRHSDGSGVCHVSLHQPIMNMRPTMNDAMSLDGIGWAHGVKADLHVAGWLTSRGIGYDVAGDEDLDREGLELLARYRAVITGTHPEYWTGRMLDAAEAYLAAGGRFVYLGGNGMYWVTTYVPGRPGVIEVRRSGGTQAWTADVGEYHHSSTGELGGVWRQRGRAPQRLVGIGFTSQGMGTARPYHRTPASHDPRASWIFEGIGDDELIGTEGLVVDGGAGFEIDRTDPALGTPRHALVVAVADGFTDEYQHVVEEVHSANSRQGGTVERRVRADMVFFETPNDGAVFSTGSISWGSALPVSGGRNAASLVTENVLRGFLRDGPLPGQLSGRSADPASERPTG